VKTDKTSRRYIRLHGFVLFISVDSERRSRLRILVLDSIFSMTHHFPDSTQVILLVRNDVMVKYMLRVATAQTWNGLPDDVRSSPMLPIFRRSSKTRCFANLILTWTTGLRVGSNIDIVLLLLLYCYI